MKKLSIDNPFFNLMGTAGDFILLNIVFFVTCIPVVTIGVSLTSLYRVMIKHQQGECAYPVQEYFRTFRKEWKQSTLLWLVFLITGAVLVFDILYAQNMTRVLNVAIGALALVWGFVYTYAFPLQCRFYNPVKRTLFNVHFTMLMLLLNAVPVICMVLGDFIMAMAVPVYIVIGFSLTAWVNSFLLLKIFRKI